MESFQTILMSISTQSWQNSSQSLQKKFWWVVLRKKCFLLSSINLMSWQDGIKLSLTRKVYNKTKTKTLNGKRTHPNDSAYWVKSKRFNRSIESIPSFNGWREKGRKEGKKKSYHESVLMIRFFDAFPPVRSVDGVYFLCHIWNVINQIHFSVIHNIIVQQTNWSLLCWECNS